MKIKLYYDSPDDIVDKINFALESHGLRIDYVGEEDEDGCMECEITKIV